MMSHGRRGRYYGLGGRLSTNSSQNVQPELVPPAQLLPYSILAIQYSMGIITITSISQLNGILSKDKDKLSVIDFHATWCGPCHAIAPAYESLSNQYTSVNFLKCDVDAAFEVARVYSISAMPTFIFLKGSTKVDQLKGASKSALETTLRKHAVIDPTSKAFSGKGNTLGGTPAVPDIVGDANQSLNKITTWFTQLDPQLRVLMGLVGLYLVFWCFH